MTTQFNAWMLENQQAMEISLSKNLPSETTLPEKLHEAMRYATLGGGKRIRPLLVLAAGALFDAASEDLFYAASAVEMIHVYSLVHDDMPCMDDDILRRGKPTVHVQYDEATALLVGDALQAQAFHVLTKSCAPSENVLAMTQLLATSAGSFGMCGGQSIDLGSVGIRLSLDELEKMHQLKTGALLRASVFLGALSGKILSTEETAALNAYAKAIGLAFQVVDDILDVTADSATLGKTAGKDEAENKPTYVSILGLEKSRELANTLYTSAIDALQPFGDKAYYLHQIANTIVNRNI